MFSPLSVTNISTEPRDPRKERKAEEAEDKPAGRRTQGRDYLSSLATAFSQPSLLLLLVSASVRQLAGLSWANNNVNYFKQYYQDIQVDFYWLTVCSICGGAVGVVSGNSNVTSLSAFIITTCRRLHNRQTPG